MGHFFSMNFGYTVPENWLSGESLSMNVNNVFDTLLPYRDNSGGQTAGSTVGRVIQFVFRKKWQRIRYFCLSKSEDRLPCVVPLLRKGGAFCTAIAKKVMFCIDPILAN